MRLCMYLDNVLVDSVEMLPLPYDSRYKQDLLQKLMHKHREHPELEKAEFLIEGVFSGMNAPRQRSQKLGTYLNLMNNGRLKRRSR